MDKDIEDIEELDDDLDRGDAVEDEDDSDEVDGGGLEDDDGDQEEDEGELDDDEDGDDLEEDTSKEPKDIKVPKSRLDEVISQREAEKDRVQWLEDQLEALINQKKTDTDTKPVEPKVDLYDYAKAEEDYASFLIDGETAKAAALRTQIDVERKKELVTLIKEARSETLDEANDKSKEAVEQEKFNTLINEFETKHSFLDTDSDDYNEEAVETVNTLIAGYMASGKTKSKALKVAIAKVVPMYTEDEPTTKQSLGGDRKTKARRKAAKASNAQPDTSNRSKSREDKDSIPLSSMSEKQYNSLTLKEKKTLRGD